MVLLIDNFDSYSHILADYLRQLGMELCIVRNDVDPNELKKGDWEALILSPGPETPEKAGNLMTILDEFVYEIPVLGICLGHQAIGQYFGAQLLKGLRPVHGKVHTIKRADIHPFLENLPDKFQVTRYHSLVLKALPSMLKVILETEENEIMAITHTELPILGLQYHPEAFLTEYGLNILSNWWTYCRLKKNVNNVLSINGII